MRERLAAAIRTAARRPVHACLLARLRVEAWLARRRGDTARPRVVAAACWTFPVYSQTFVQNELTALARNTFAVRVFYASLGERSALSHTCSDLWSARRRIHLHPATGAADLRRFKRRMPQRVAALTQRLADAAGMRPDVLERHEHFLEAMSFARAVEAWDADYVHSYFFYEQSLFALVASQLLDLPRGVSCYSDHVLDDYELKVVPFHIETADLLVATSRRARSEIGALDVGASGTTLVKPNAIDTASFAMNVRTFSPPDEPLRVLCVCRLDRKKGLEFLIDAVRLAEDRGVRVRATILGDADSHSPDSMEYAASLRALVERLGVSTCVSFAGRCSSRDVRASLAGTHVFVMPSVDLPGGDKDGIPTALLEAMAAGCPIVATDAGAICEAVADGREALIVPQRAPDALATALEALARDEGLAARLSAGALERVQRDFDVARTERLFHESVRRAIERRGKR